ncbi:amino acid permease [Coniophora puteana RWD-64-598 SS2]|uniref:Amino acid permease n=1 Tax=Coniophora puteana (strain RWD-64-598) TaxID=741705 RepID=A0A5M3N6S4_CONPW|nr:amino acid permease [Coniophora puteana RWD-64-598 SS2]EIW86545.1 amino acid permease [Coniophora puteana RWD-64-598 SS2]
MSESLSEKDTVKVNAGAVKGDIESDSYDGDGVPNRTLHRQLKNRHVAMISMGGVIGTGLFLGTANALMQGGPVGMLLGYTAMGTVVFAMMTSLGEMVSYLPIPGGHIKLAERFVNPAFSFAMGWNYWYNWLITAPVELSASAVLVNYWNHSVNDGVWIAIFAVVVIAINLLGAGAYGEAEFIFASIKIITIVGLIILGIVLDLGGGPDHDRLGFRYWKNPGPFAQYLGIAGAEGRFLGFWAVLVQASFSFQGTEIVAIAAGEAKNPRRNLPKAVKRVYIRILFFYILGTLMIGLLVPYNNPRLNLADGTAAASPFVIAIEIAGIKALPSIINASLLTAATSAASSDIYTSSRALFGLAAAGNAPKIFLRVTKNGMPWVSVTFCSLFVVLAYMSLGSGSAGQVFDWLSTMTSISGLMTWFGISITYIQFYKGTKAQGLDRTTFPYWTRFQPFCGYYSAVACFVIAFFSAFNVFIHDQWNTATFVTSYLPFIGFFILYGGAYLYYRVPPVKPADMDFVTNIAEIEADEVDDPPPKNKMEAFWAWLM